MNKEKIVEWETQLAELMDQLNKGEIKLIEFGDPAFQISDYYSRIRIRLTMTPGGYQFGMHFVSLYRGEGSGSYYPRNRLGRLHCILDAMKEVKHYTDDSLAQKYRAARGTGPDIISGARSDEGRALSANTSASLLFTGHKDESHIKTPLLQKLHAQEEAEGRGFLPGATTIRLG